MFFQVGGTDYDAHIGGLGGLQLFEKPGGTLSGLNPDGSLNLGSPWVPASSQDLLLARLHSAVGFEPSGDNASPHVIVEFDLSINTGGPGPPNGIYDPAPAFWSTSGKNGTDPPFTSGIFTLTGPMTFVQPVFGAGGGPALQPQNVVPEPSSLLLLGSGLVGLVTVARKRARR